MIGRTVHPVHFGDLDGHTFERLVFAYHLRAGWADLAWYGRTGSDLGRDIIGVEPFDDEPNRMTVIQCVNRADLTLAKAKEDMRKAAGAPTGIPQAFKFVCRGTVSAERRDAIKAEAKALSIRHTTIWTSEEFEENLRLRAEFLLRRFFDGETFPDTPDDLRRFVDDFPELTDDDALELMAAVFDRPAFRTPFQQESYLPAFAKAIEDTIQALNTGLWRIRDGAEIRRIPSIHHLQDAKKKATVSRVVRELDQVRRMFKQHLDAGRIRHCGCDVPDCPTFMMDTGVAAELDAARTTVLLSFKSIWPEFVVQIR